MVTLTSLTTVQYGVLYTITTDCADTSFFVLVKITNCDCSCCMLNTTKYYYCVVEESLITVLDSYELCTSPPGSRRRDIMGRGRRAAAKLAI